MLKRRVENRQKFISVSVCGTEFVEKEEKVWEFAVKTVVCLNFWPESIFEKRRSRILLNWFEECEKMKKCNKKSGEKKKRSCELSLFDENWVCVFFLKMRFDGRNESSSAEEKLRREKISFENKHSGLIWRSMSKNDFEDCKRQMKTALTEECFAPYLSFAFEAECHKSVAMFSIKNASELRTYE